jgi:hypothetical protein
MLTWSGQNPIVVFGRITYVDSKGKKYCTPYGAAHYDGQTFSNLSEFPPTKIKLAELCPPGYSE